MSTGRLQADLSVLVVFCLGNNCQNENPKVHSYAAIPLRNLLSSWWYWIALEQMGNFDARGLACFGVSWFKDMVVRHTAHVTKQEFELLNDCVFNSIHPSISTPGDIDGGPKLRLKQTVIVPSPFSSCPICFLLRSRAVTFNDSRGLSKAFKRVECTCWRKYWYAPGTIGYLHPAAKACRAAQWSTCCPSD